MPVIDSVSELTPEKALIFRVTHIDNVAWILDHGLHCRASALQDQNFVPIGNPDLIQERRRQRVPIAPGDTLDHYIPFYFTPCSMMLYNLRTGWNNMTRRTPAELVFFVASLRSLQACGVPFVFADRHAFMRLARFSTSLNDLEHLAWRHWQQRDFRRDPNNPQKTERYQAETLVHRHLAVETIDAIVCGDDDATTRVTEMVSERGSQIEVHRRRQWFF
ncbi:MAG: DUF4433 domain-containing protein [Acidobacteria bacterium]|nr:DUF4433 domain-containing protein [Acidobacteriota bacterium]